MTTITTDFLFGICIGLTIWVIILAVKHDRLEGKIKSLETKMFQDWYNLNMKITSNSNKIETIDDFLKTIHPDMNKTIMSKYANNRKAKDDLLKKITEK